MSNQELLTYLFNAIALGYLTIAVIDFGTRAVAVYNQVKVTSNSPSTNIEKPLTQLSLAPIPQVRPQLPDPWLLPLPIGESVGLVKSLQKEQKHLRLLPQAKETSMVTAPKLELYLTNQKCKFLVASIGFLGYLQDFRYLPSLAYLQLI